MQLWQHCAKLFARNLKPIAPGRKTCIKNFLKTLSNWSFEHVESSSDNGVENCPSEYGKNIFSQISGRNLLLSFYTFLCTRRRQLQNPPDILPQSFRTKKLFCCLKRNLFWNNFFLTHKMHLLQPCQKISAKIQFFLFSFQPNMSHIFFRKKKKFSSIVPLDTENDVLIILSKFHCHDLPSFSDQRLKRIWSNLFFKKTLMFYPSKFFRQFLKCYRSLHRNKDPLYFFLCDTHEVFFRKPKKQFPQPYLHSHVQKSWQLSLQFQKQFYEKMFFS